MCSGDGGTRQGRGGDSDIEPSEPLTAIEKGMRGKGTHSERSVFEGMVVREVAWSQHSCRSHISVYETTPKVCIANS
jgi:hypothetical protein